MSFSDEKILFNKRKITLEQFFPSVLIGKADYYRELFNSDLDIILLLAYIELILLDSGHFFYSRILDHLSKELDLEITREKLEVCLHMWLKHHCIFEFNLPNQKEFAINYIKWLLYHEKIITDSEYYSLISKLEFNFLSGKNFQNKDQNLNITERICELANKIIKIESYIELSLLDIRSSTHSFHSTKILNSLASTNSIKGVFKFR